MLSIDVLMSYLIPAIMVLVVLKLLSLPVKLIIRVLINLILGGLILVGLSALGIITVSLTWWMTAIVGVLGVPGAIIVAVINFLMI